MSKKNKKGVKANVFKVAGAKSLKKTKSKAVNLGLKNIKQKIQDIDKEFVEVSKNLKSKPSQSASKSEPKPAQKSSKPIVTKEEVAKAAEQVVKMDL